MKRGSRRTIRLDGGAASIRIIEPLGFLRDYWMGRYLGLIEASTATDKTALTVEPSNQQFGAAPYDSPGRPEF